MNANAVVHAASTPVTAHHGVPHGVANAIFLPPGLDLIRPACEEKLGEIAEALGEDVSGLSPADAAKARSGGRARALLRLRPAARRCAPGASIPAAMDVPRLIEDAMKSRNIATNPRPIGPPELAELYARRCRDCRDHDDPGGKCAMKMGLFSVLFNDKPLEEVAKYASDLGYEAFELAAWRGSNHFDTDRAATDPQYAKGIKKMLADHGIEISALSNHLSSQMVLPFGDSSLDEWAGTSDKDEMVKFGTEHIIKTAQVASEIEIGVVNGFFGSTVWESWYIWPPQRLDIYEKGWDLCVGALGADPRRVQEATASSSRTRCIPTEIAYNVYTAREAVKRMPRDDWGFNFDPSHFIWQQIDPVVFIKEFGTAHLPRAREGLGAAEGHRAHRRRHGHGLLAARRPRGALPRAGLGRRRVAPHHHRAARGRLRLRALVRARGSGHERGGRLRAVHQVPQAALHQEAARPRPGVVAGMSEEKQVGFVTMGDQRAGDDAIPEIGIGMLGYAFMGRAHSNALKKIAYVTWPPPYIPRLVAIAGRNEEAVREAARRYGYEKYSTSWEDVVSDPDVQIFDNGGPNDAHLEPTVAAAKAGKHVICEKPLGRDADESLRDLAAGRRHRREAHDGVQLPLLSGDHPREAADRGRRARRDLPLPRRAITRSG